MSPRRFFVSNKKVATPSLFVVRFCRGTLDVLSVSHKWTSLSGIGVLLKLTTLTCLKVKKRLIRENGNGFCCIQINSAMQCNATQTVCNLKDIAIHETKEELFIYLLSPPQLIFPCKPWVCQ